ncbi:MAG: preprotein translocase subunit SecE [Candidatus Falkowbacteria bacterium]|nr:preprotein translocase subunit SecE [Candidatus Falkowbacteria bacterium]
MDTLKQYLKDSYEEVKKVTWPTKQEVINYTLLVIVVSVVIAGFLGGLDFLFSYGLDTILQANL